MEQLILQLHDINFIKFGTFKLKSNIISPFYFDFRNLISYPKIMKSIINLFTNTINIHNYNIITGIPYTGVPIASYLSYKEDIPMIIKRKEQKTYGTKKLIEGIYNDGDSCLVIDDLITSGTSLIETIEVLEKENIKIDMILVILDREQGGYERIKDKGYNIVSILKITDVLDVLLKNDRISKKIYDDTLRFISDHRF